MKNFLTDIELFITTVQAGSFTKAADSLDMAKSTLSARISALEKDLGILLLNRTTRKLELTEAGQLYFDKAKFILKEADNLKIELKNFQKEPEGLLSITKTDDFAKDFLSLHLLEFCRTYPHIRFNLHLSQEIDDLIIQHFDLAIRIGEQPDSQLIVRQIAAEFCQLYASPEYLSKIAKITSIADLPQSGYILFKSDFVSTWQLEREGDNFTIPVRGNLMTNSPGMNANLAATGNGIALLPKLVAAKFVQEGKLQTILPNLKSREIPIYAVTTSKLLPEKTRIFIAFLQKKLHS